MRSRLLLAPLLLLIAPCSRPGRFSKASPWPEADRLFRQDSRWLGGDGAYSVPLEEGRDLWLFGDSFVKDPSDGKRAGSAMVRNSVGIMTGSDPSRAKMKFFWGKGPKAFFPGRKGEWLWPGAGIRLGEGLLLFFVRVREEGGGPFGFAAVGWTARLIENPGDAPASWRFRELKLPETAGKATVGSGGVLVWRGHLYAYSPVEPDHRVLLLRWPLGKAGAGDLSAPEWRNAKGWGAKKDAAPVFENGQTESTVHYDKRSNRFVQAQSVGFGAADLALRYAERPEGPWSDPEKLFTPEECGRKDAFVYAGKAHPQLRGADLVLSYASNAWEFSVLVEDTSLYYPRFVRLKR